MLQGLAAAPATGAEAIRPYLLTLLAEGYLHQGQVQEGLNTLTEALEIEQKGGECFLAAERYRLKGELLLRLSAQSFGQSSGQDQQSRGRKGRTARSPDLQSDLQAEAESCFQHALGIARQQEAKALELRAGASLSRLWQQQGKTQAAQQMLAPIYSWFTEGFDTPDLQEAKAVLDMLS